MYHYELGWFYLWFIIVLFTIITIIDASSMNTELYFTKTPEDVPVVEKAQVKLFCDASPNEGILYYWELNGLRLKNTTRRFMNGSNLIITRVDRERDTGQFTCIVEDISRENHPIISSPASLLIEFIEDPEVLLQEPENAKEIKNGARVVLKCHLEASGDVYIEWFRNADLILTDNMTNIEIRKRKLIFNSVNSTINNGVYKCAAKNMAGRRVSTKSLPLIVEGKNSPIIRILPVDHIAKRENSVFFDCVYEQVDLVQWHFINKESSQHLKSNSKRIIIHSNGTLQINNVSKTDEGLYNCIGIKNEFNNTLAQSYSAELQIAYLEDFNSSSFEPNNSEGLAVIGEGSFFQITCLDTNSLPKAKKFWQNALGHTISDRGEIYVDDGCLIIKETQLSDAGIYTCVAENLAGKTEQRIKIIVTSKPQIVQNPLSVTVDEGDQAVLICLFNSVHPEYTTVKWQKDGKYLKFNNEETITHSSRIMNFKHSDNNGTLVIYSTQIQDRGEYICEILTSGHAAIRSQSATISIIERLRFVTVPVNKILELETVAKMHCKAQGTPPPIIRWEKEGLATFDKPFPRHIMDVNGTLHFNRVTLTDKGIYRCIASNSQGIINATIKIDVGVAPYFHVLPKTPIDINEGEAVTLDCLVEGDPKPSLKWDYHDAKADDESDLGRFLILPNGSLHIKEVSHTDQNVYGCTAGNSVGFNRSEIQLIVHNNYEGDQGERDSTVTKAFLITMSVAASYIILVIGLMVWCKYVRSSRKIPTTNIDNCDENKPEYQDDDVEDGDNQLFNLGPSVSSSIEHHKDGQKSDAATDTCNSQKSNNYEALSFLPSLLNDLTLMGRGEFGDIMIGKINQTDNKDGGDSEQIPILVKTLRQVKDENSLTEFKREIDMFSKLKHKHISKLIGLCRQDEPHYLVMEYTDWGDLKKFLIATKSGNPPALAVNQSVALAYQLSSGMEHLSNHRMVHRDLAARNCLITSNLVLKISLPRMTKEPYSQEYCKFANQIIPLRWLPYEAVYEDDYSTKSDVYSFAVVIWEIFFQGELPHSKINDNTFLTKLKDHKLEWKCSSATPQELESLLILCWNVNPMNRPSFPHLYRQIAEILNNM